MFFGPSRTDHDLGFKICHQGAELLSDEGEKMGVLAIYGDSKASKGPKQVVKVPK